MALRCHPAYEINIRTVPQKREECDVSSGSQNSQAPHEHDAAHDGEGQRTRHDPQDRSPAHVVGRCPQDDGTSTKH